jgi:hypothetical protein
MPMILATDVNGRGDAALDHELGLVAQKHDPRKHLHK